MECEGFGEYEFFVRKVFLWIDVVLYFMIFVIVILFFNIFIIRQVFCVIYSCKFL